MEQGECGSRRGMRDTEGAVSLRETTDGFGREKRLNVKGRREGRGYQNHVDCLGAKKARIDAKGGVVVLHLVCL